MNTYYELITFIISLEDIDNDAIEKLNNFNINLEGERYNRFINHITNLLDNRINNLYEQILNELNSIDNEKDFKRIINNILSENEHQIKFIKNKLIKEEEQNKLNNFIKENNNEIINRLKRYYNKHTNITNYLDSYYIS